MYHNFMKYITLKLMIDASALQYSIRCMPGFNLAVNSYRAACNRAKPSVMVAFTMTL